ncbi:hypothetical protein SLEP1_g38911 [Rubroshorea leprosula]|uniref:Uncharacterized protein n=1 Tax=Rubroshorea leprosula TaxID=152421 RepID=A0AAV5KYX9_9ROSI|nr:hypothetical protein SLEP1_g38911 [Rubroshorea leprosula]
MLNSTKESTSLLASVYRYNLFERATSLPSGPSPMTDTTVVRTVQNLPFSLFPVRIQNFDPSSTDLHILALRARNFAPPPKVHHASISKNLTINLIELPQPIVRLPAPDPPLEVLVPFPYLQLRVLSDGQQWASQGRTWALIPCEYCACGLNTSRLHWSIAVGRRIGEALAERQLLSAEDGGAAQRMVKLLQQFWVEPCVALPLPLP